MLDSDDKRSTITERMEVARRLETQEVKCTWQVEGPAALSASEGLLGWRVAKGMGRSETELNILTREFATKRTKAKC